MKRYHLVNIQHVGWSSDAFINWLTQNSINIASQVAMLGGNIAGSIINEGGFSSNLGGNIGLNSAQTILGLIGQFHSASILPNIQGSQPTGDVIWGANRNKFTFRQMRVKNENLKIIDDYFSTFGYKINEVKIPNVTGRTNWNYVKTIDCNLLR